jgi:hypothetical protein
VSLCVCASIHKCVFVCVCVCLCVFSRVRMRVLAYLAQAQQHVGVGDPESDVVYPESGGVGEQHL